MMSVMNMKTGSSRSPIRTSEPGWSVGVVLKLDSDPEVLTRF